MKTKSIVRNRNEFLRDTLALGTLNGTPHRHGASLFGSKENRQSCSYVPYSLYILKTKEHKAKENRKHTFLRVKGIWCPENTGVQYA